jgi:TonB family protein
MTLRIVASFSALLLAGGCAADQSARTRSLQPLASLFSDDDYPASALRADETGTVAYELHVSPAGEVADCSITASSGSASLDSATCRLLQARARFEPARDRRGRPVGDTVIGRIVWRLPEEDEAPPTGAPH